jgi:hypothetical protein
MPCRLAWQPSGDEGTTIPNLLQIPALDRRLECRVGDQGLLEGVEGLVGSRVLGKVLLQQLRERVNNQPIILDEFTIVTREAEEAL